jgi:Glycosyl transferase family 2
VLDEHDVPLECIVVDDGSTDGTADVVRALGERDPRIVLELSPSNEGPSAARNRGLPLARGEWLTFLDADDRMYPGAVAALYRAAVDTAARVVVGQRVWSDGQQTWVTKLYDQPDIREPGRKSLITHPGLLYYASGTGKLFHRSCTDDLWFKGRVLGDQPWTIRAMLRAGDRIEVIGDTVYEWTRPGPGNEFVSITSAKRDSARGAAVAVGVAVGALRDVIDESERVLPSPADRHVIARGYFDRLVRADFAGPVTRGIERREPGMAELLDALAAFVDAAPAGIATESQVLVDRVLRPPLTHWRSLDGRARAAYWRLSAVASRIDPRVSRRIGGHVSGTAVRIVGPRGGRVRRAVAGALMTSADGVRRVVSWRRQR